MERVTLARNAMATRFEFVLVGANSSQLRGAGEEALDEIERIESRFSLYRSGSEIAQINARAAHEPVRVSPEVFELLLRGRAFFELSKGAFDPTVAPLVRAWGFMKGGGSRPTDEEISAAHALVGMDSVDLNEEHFTVRFARSGMMLDLGSIGKGYALDRAAEILRDSGVEHGLLHGGTSTIVALGSDPETGPWKVAIEHPDDRRTKVIAVIGLTNESLSVSAIWGKFFEIEGKKFGHVVDPRTGWPAEHALLGAVILKTATATDALSTAVLLGTEPDLTDLAKLLPEMRYLQLRGETEADTQILSNLILESDLRSNIRN